MLVHLCPAHLNYQHGLDPANTDLNFNHGISDIDYNYVLPDLFKCAYLYTSMGW